MKLLDINIISAVVILFIVKHINGEQRLVNFTSGYQYYSSSREQSIDKLPVNFEVTLSGESFITKFGEVVLKGNPAQVTIDVSCQLLISINNQSTGIYTCQDDDGDYYLIPSLNITHTWAPTYHHLRVSCDNLFVDIIEGEEVQIQCEVQPASYYFQGKIIIGWIQGENNITQLLNLNSKTIKKINQTFIGFKSGEGIFFYCIKIEFRSIHCYTLTLNVLPQLKVKILPLYEAPESPGQRCFMCLATGVTDDQVYNWNLGKSKLTLKDDHKTQICLNNLTVGVYTIECVVSTNAQNRSDVMEFTVEDDIPTDTRHKTTVIILAVATTILVFVVLILVYALIRKHESHGLQTVMYQQRGVHIGGTIYEVPEFDEEDDVHHGIEDISEEPTENNYINENFTPSKRDTDAEICHRREAETTYYYALDP